MSRTDDKVPHGKPLPPRSQFGAVQGVFQQLLSTAVIYCLGYRIFWGWAEDSLAGMGLEVSYVSHWIVLNV